MARRLGGELLARADAVLSGIDLLPCDAIVRARAGGDFAPPQRALDAIHLATALALGGDRLALVTYDRRQARAARQAGLAVATPA